MNPWATGVPQKAHRLEIKVTVESQPLRTRPHPPVFLPVGNVGQAAHASSALCQTPTSWAKGIARDAASTAKNTPLPAPHSTQRKMKLPRVVDDALIHTCRPHTLNAANTHPLRILRAKTDKLRSSACRRPATLR